MQLTLVIKDESRSKFFNKVEELLLSPPEWVSHYIQTVRQTLDSIPSEISSNYIYAPKYSYNGVKIEFECTKNNYKLYLKKDLASIESALQILRGTNPNMPSNTQSGSESLPERKQAEKTFTETTKPNKVVYSGPVTYDSVNQFPSDLQSHASKLAQSDFPYTTTINSNGSVKVAGSVTFVGETISIMDLLKKMEDQKNTST